MLDSFPPKGKFAVKSVLLKYQNQNIKNWNCYDTTQQAY